MSPTGQRRIAHTRFPRFAGVVLLALVGLASFGCSSTKWVTLRNVPQTPLSERLKLTTSGGLRPSDRTFQLLRVYNLTEDLQEDNRQLLQKLQGITDNDPSPDKVFALAELAYLGGKKVEKRDSDLARDLYGASVLHAYRYLFDARFCPSRNPYDPQFRGACDLYNGALEASLRIECRDRRLLPGRTATIQTAVGPWDVTCTLRGGVWQPEEFDHFDFVSNYEIKGLKNQYQTYGLGVPLIAVRRAYTGEPAAAKYYPENLSFPVTAFLRPLPATVKNQFDVTLRYRAALELYDPLSTTDILNAGVRIPLESDLTTPLAYFLSDPRLGELANDGLLHPEKLLNMRSANQKPVVGLWMVQPYEPGKIPVVMVHGLWSSPMTWMEMFNDLRSLPQIRERYQFWFYLYPTGQPFWMSAAMMRRDLAAVRGVLDPARSEPSLDQMILIGHSMGGLVSRLQTIASGDLVWQLVSQEPISQIKADPAVLEKMQQTFYFQPNPSIRRVVTIGTPHRGSSFSNQTTQWLLGKLIHLPQMLVQSQQQLFRENPSAFGAKSLLRVENSIDSLAPDAPIFTVMLTAPHPPSVHYHNIVGSVPEQGVFGKLAAGSDGVVSLASAKVEGMESELVVPADHTTVHSHPLAVLEVRRILLEHLAAVESFPGSSGERTAQIGVLQQ